MSVTFGWWLHREPMNGLHPNLGRSSRTTAYGPSAYYDGPPVGLKAHPIAFIEVNDVQSFLPSGLNLIDRKLPSLLLTLNSLGCSLLGGERKVTARKPPKYVRSNMKAPKPEHTRTHTHRERKKSLHPFSVCRLCYPLPLASWQKFSSASTA